MSKFPLYNNLSTDIPTNDLTTTQKRTFIKRIVKIDKKGYELIYALIRMYQIENVDNNKVTESLPYNGTSSNTGISFDLEDLPNTLKQILFKFVAVHLKTMKEEKDRSLKIGI